MQVSSHTINKFKKPEKLSKKLSKKDRGEYWFYYITGGFNKHETFEQHLSWLAGLGHFYYVTKDLKVKKGLCFSYKK